jgi:hypothetical protein
MKWADATECCAAIAKINAAEPRNADCQIVGFILSTSE